MTSGDNSGINGKKVRGNLYGDSILRNIIDRLVSGGIIKQDEKEDIIGDARRIFLKLDVYKKKIRGVRDFRNFSSTAAVVLTVLRKRGLYIHPDVFLGLLTDYPRRKLFIRTLRVIGLLGLF